jgi:hypothetical protein
MRTFLTKTEAVAQAQKWIEKQGTPPAAEWGVGQLVGLSYPCEVHSLEPDSGGNGGLVIVGGQDNEAGSVIAVHWYRGEHKAFEWDSRGNT